MEKIFGKVYQQFSDQGYDDCQAKNVKISLLIDQLEKWQLLKVDNHSMNRKLEACVNWLCQKREKDIMYNSMLNKSFV